MKTAKPFAWSHSRLTAWETCPAKFEFDNRPENKRLYDDPNSAANYGKDVHAKFEAYVRDGNPLPLDLQHHRGALDKLRGLGDPLAEQKLAITNDFRPTGWFDSDVWCRAIIDFCAIDASNRVGIITDYKTGKRRLEWEQVQMQAALLHCYDLDVRGYVVSYYWTKDKKFDRDKFQLEDIPELWNKLLPRVAKMEEAIKQGDYPPKHNFLCGRFCANTECKFHGK